ncbi:Centromere/microtubule-binding protein cbf5, partial [Colletotrichum scovillei]
SEKSLQGRDDLAQVRLIPGVVHGPLSIKHVVQSNHLLALAHGTRAHSSELLHVATNTEQQTLIHNKAELTTINVTYEMDAEGTDRSKEGAGRGHQSKLHRESEYFRQLRRGFLNQLTLESAGELDLAAGQLVVKANDGNILLTSRLLGLDESGSTVDAGKFLPRRRSLMVVRANEFRRLLREACLPMAIHVFPNMTC